MTITNKHSYIKLNEARPFRLEIGAPPLKAMLFTLKNKTKPDIKLKWNVEIKEKFKRYFLINRLKQKKPATNI